MCESESESEGESEKREREREREGENYFYLHIEERVSKLNVINFLNEYESVFNYCICLNDSINIITCHNCNAN